MAVVGSDEIRFSIVEESTPGVTPATPTFEVLAITNESVQGNATTQTSNAMNSSGIVQDTFLTKLEGGGDIGIEFADTAGVRLLIESALADAFIAADGAPGPVPPGNEPGTSPVVCELKSTRKAFTIEVRFPDPNNAGQFLYQRYPGCQVNTFTINAAPGDAVTASFTVIGGKTPVPDTSAIAGATYNLWGSPTVFRGPDFVTLSIVGIAATQLNCANGFSATLNANIRGQECLGTLGNNDLITGQRVPGGTIQFYYVDNDILDGLINQTEFTLTAEVENGSGNYFALRMFRCKVTANPVVASGPNTDVINDMSFQAAYDSTPDTAMRFWFD